jgi:predicted CDP-diglyceride synthetase/phosphatidate cytidylyltransferase
LIAKAANDYVMETNIVFANYWHYLVIVLATTITNKICVTLISIVFIGIAAIRYFLMLRKIKKIKKINPNSCA